MVGSETDPGVEFGFNIIWMVEEVYCWMGGQFAEVFSLSIYLSKTVGAQLGRLCVQIPVAERLCDQNPSPLGSRECHAKSRRLRRWRSGHKSN